MEQSRGELRLEHSAQAEDATPLYASRKKAAVALSGGVDSSVCSFLLQQQGYEVIGVTGKMVNTPNADIVVENARQVAEKLGIKHYVVDVCDDFQKNVIDYFEKAYKNGETPNPCIVCNKYIKWGTLLDYAFDELNADVFATGHYANIKKTGDFYSLYPAKDSFKDQLYFLFELNQKQLSKTIFPLYEYEKSQIRQIAVDNDLPSKSSKESQDICFIQKPMTTKKYLLEKLGSTKGDLIELKTGKKLGEHDGCFQFTVGQRKGIGVSSERPLYVIKTDAVNNIVYLGHEEENFDTVVQITDTNILEPSENNEFDAMVKIRYNMQAKKAHVKLSQNEAKIEFYEPISSITSGQAGVIYDLEDGRLIGGGWVK